jgi:hypothetical protein
MARIGKLGGAATQALRRAQKRLDDEYEPVSVSDLIVDPEPAGAPQ